MLAIRGKANDSTQVQEKAKHLITNEEASTHATYAQSLTTNIITHGMPHQQIQNGTRIQKPTQNGTITMDGITATHSKKTGLKDTRRRAKAVQTHLGFRAPRLRQFKVQ